MSADNDAVAGHVAVAPAVPGDAMLSVDEATSFSGAVARDRATGVELSADRNFALAWKFAGLVLCADVVWFPFSRLHIADPPTFVADLAMVVGIVVCYFVLREVHRRLIGDTHRVARTISRLCEQSSLAVYGFIFQIVLLGSVVGFTYLAASLDWPLRDAQLAAIDRWLGFDWPGFLALSNSHAWWASVLFVAYESSGPQLILVYLLLGLMRRRARLAELSLLVSLTATATILLYLLVPAAGAYAFYAPAPEIFDHFDPKAGMWHYGILLELRNGAMPTFAFEGSQGIVVFPSFHTMLAVLMPYAVRDVGKLFWPVVMLNVLVVISTIPEGGHHLIDVIAGLAIAFGAIGIVRHLSRAKT